MIRRWEARYLHLAVALVGGTGVVWGVMRYLLEPVDEFSVVNHPWEPHLQHLHVVVAPFLVFGFGLIWKRHIADRWSSPLVARRRSGRLLAVLAGVMVLSGYLLQVTTAPDARQIWVVLHVASSLIWLAGYGVHQLSSDRAPAAP